MGIHGGSGGVDEDPFRVALDVLPIAFVVILSDTIEKGVDFLCDFVVPSSHHNSNYGRQQKQSIVDIK